MVVVVVSEWWFCLNKRDWLVDLIDWLVLIPVSVVMTGFIIQ